MTSGERAVSFVTSIETSWAEPLPAVAAAAAGSLIDSDMARCRVNLSGSFSFSPLSRNSVFPARAVVWGCRVNPWFFCMRGVEYKEYKEPKDERKRYESKKN